MPETGPPDGFVSVAEAARRWRVSERTAYRRAKALPPSDTVSEDKRIYVRQEVAPERESPSPPSDTTLPEVPTGDGNTSDRPSDTGEDLAGVLREVITRQDAEISYLREALQREQSISMSLATDAQELRRKLLALAPLEKPVEGDSTNPGVSVAAEGGQNAASEAQASQAGHSGSEALPWWRRLFGTGGSR